MSFINFLGQNVLVPQDQNVSILYIYMYIYIYIICIYWKILEQFDT